MFLSRELSVKNYTPTPVTFMLAFQCLCFREY